MPVNDFTHFQMSWRPARAELGDGPLYLALAAALERDIATGSLPPGTRLPPQRELADYLDIDFTTVTRAYGICREKGLVYGVTGRGTFVSEMPGAGRAEQSAAFDLGVVQGFPFVGEEEILSAARAVLGRESAGRLFTYEQRDGRSRAREAGRLWLAQRGVAVPATRLAVFPGVQSALSAALLGVFHVGDALAVDAFTYANLIGLARLARIRLVPVAGDQSGMRADGLAEAVEKQGVRGVFLMPSCANPTTVRMSARRRDELADLVARHNLLVLEDDASLLYDSAGTLFARVPEHTLYLAGSSRLIAAGLRATFVAYPEDLRVRLLSGLHHTAIKAGALEAEVLAELVLTGAAESIVAHKAQLAAEANRVFNQVFGARERKNDCRLFRMVPLAAESAGHGPELERRLVAEGIRAFHSDRFRVARGSAEAFLRVSLSSSRGASALAEGLARLKRFCADVRKA